MQTTLTAGESDLLEQANAIVRDLNAKRAERGEDIMFAVTTARNGFLVTANGELIGHPDAFRWGVESASPEAGAAAKRIADEVAAAIPGPGRWLGSVI